MTYAITNCNHTLLWRVSGTKQEPEGMVEVVVAEGVSEAHARHLLTFSSPEDDRYAECDKCGYLIRASDGPIIKVAVIDTSGERTFNQTSGYSKDHW